MLQHTRTTFFLNGGRLCVCTAQYMLGFAEEPEAAEDLLRHRFPSKMGGRPVRGGGRWVERSAGGAQDQVVHDSLDLTARRAKGPPKRAQAVTSEQWLLRARAASGMVPVHSKQAATPCGSWEQESQRLLRIKTEGAAMQIAQIRHGF